MVTTPFDRNQALLEGAPPGAMGEPPTQGPAQAGGGTPPVLDFGGQMLQAFKQDPSPDAQAQLAMVISMGSEMLQQTAGGQGPQASPQGAPPMAGQPQMIEGGMTQPLR